MGFWGGEVIKSWNMVWNSRKNKTNIYNLITKLNSFIIQKTIRLRPGIKIIQFNKKQYFCNKLILDEVSDGFLIAVWGI
jgi:hypothetical protein